MDRSYFIVRRGEVTRERSAIKLRRIRALNASADGLRPNLSCKHLLIVRGESGIRIYCTGIYDDATYGVSCGV